jgi:class 3 adenylate cyclase/tetratricopeptide (TPR) repeat protein
MSDTLSEDQSLPSLTLSVGQDDALQQVFRNTQGGLQVGETADFRSGWMMTKNHSVSPIAGKIMKALEHLNTLLLIYADQTLADLPWATWLGKTIDWRDTSRSKPTHGLQQDRSYRNVVSLSYDIVSSTAMMKELGAEQYFVLIKQLHAKFSQICSNWQGKSDLSQGDDGCMCYFGADRADEHAAQFAMSAAHEMQTIALANRWPVRIGLAQGWVAIEGGQPVGLSVHMAARVQKAAAPASVWLTTDLQAKLSDRWTFAEVWPEQNLKGFSADVGLAQLTGLASAAQEPLHAIKDQNLSEDYCVGRESSIEALVSAWHVVCTGLGQDCSVHGIAGIGKSTLLRHALKQINAPRVVHLRSNPHDERVVFGALRAWLAAELRVPQHIPKSHQLEKFYESLDTNPRWKKFEYALLDLLELPKPEAQFEEPLAQHKNMMLAMLQWAQEEAKVSPLVIVIDDYQWADASTQEWVVLLKASLGAGFALLLIIGERIEESLTWKYPKANHAIKLEPLSAAQASQLINKVAPKLALNPHWVGVVQSRARGVPLFLRETAMLFDSDEQQKKIEQAQKLGQPLDVPASLQDLLLQRLDQLNSLKSFAQTASIIGQEFSWTDVLELHSSGHSISVSAQQQVLQDLLKSGVWVEQTPFKTANQMGERLTFSHGMLGDVAYQSMWESDRRRLHAAAAQLLENKRSQDPLRVTQLARHWAAAGETMLAIDQLLAEGKISKKRGAHIIAVQCMEAALELLYTQSLTSETRAKRIDAHLGLAGQIMVTQGYSAKAVHEHALHAVELSHALEEPKALLRSQLSLQSVYFMRGDFADAHRLLDESLVVAVQVKHPLTTLQHQWACGNLAFYEGDFKKAERTMADCVQWCNEHDIGAELVQNPRVMAQMYRAFSLWCLGRAGDAMEAAVIGCEWADSGVHRLTRVQAHGIAAMVFYGCGLWRETLDSAERATASCEKSEYAMWLAHAGFMRGAALAQLGEVQAGIEQMRQQHAHWASSGGILTRTYYWALEAEILKNNHDMQGARRTIMQAKQMMMKIPERYYVSEVRRIAACLQWDSTSDIDAKLSAYEQLLEAYSDAVHRQAWGMAFRVATSMLECCRDQPQLLHPNKQRYADVCLLECVQHLQPSAQQSAQHNDALTQSSAQVISLNNFRKTAI